jgi:chromosome segregation ATPase
MPSRQWTEAESNEMLTCSRSAAGGGDPHRDVLRAIEVARRNHVELERRSLELKTAIRHEEQTVAKWRRKIDETEQLLARLRGVLKESESRLERSRHEFSVLARSYGNSDGQSRVD